MHRPIIISPIYSQNFPEFNTRRLYIIEYFISVRVPTRTNTAKLPVSAHGHRGNCSRPIKKQINGPDGRPHPMIPVYLTNSICGHRHRAVPLARRDVARAFRRSKCTIKIPFNFRPNRKSIPIGNRAQSSNVERVAGNSQQTPICQTPLKSKRVMLTSRCIVSREVEYTARKRLTVDYKGVFKRETTARNKAHSSRRMALFLFSFRCQSRDISRRLL